MATIHDPEALASEKESAPETEIACHRSAAASYVKILNELAKSLAGAAVNQAK